MTIGLVVSAFLAAGVATVATSVREEQSQGTLELVVASGVAPVRLSLGVAVFPLIEAVGRSALYLGTALVLGMNIQDANVGTAFLGLAIGSGAFVGLGLIGVCLVLVFRRATAAVAWIVGLAAFASGVVFPPRVLPEWLQTLARFSPVTIALEIVRGALLGDYAAGLIARTPLPPVLLPFLLATLVRLVQGSGTVAIITSASITAPILATAPVNPVIAAQAAALGAMVFSYFNDSYFWVVNRLLGIDDVKDQVRVWSVPTTIGWAISGALVTVLSFVVPA